MRYLTILGLLGAVATLAALSTPTAGAISEETVQGYFVAEVENSETAGIDGEQLGPNLLAIGSLPPLVCPFVKYNGEATTVGPVSSNVTISPTYELCHTIIPALGTRTVTVTMNGCTFDIEATATITEGEEEHFLGDPDIECPAGKQMEVHVYNTSNPNDTGASTLCTYDIEPQTDLTGITFTNNYNEPTAVDDVVADFNVASIDVTRTAGSEELCGPINQTAAYLGQATFRATSEEGEFVAAEVANKKRFIFSGEKALTFKGENGNAKLTTEKGAIECAKVKYEGTPAGRQTDELTIKPTYSECKFDSLTAHFEFNECTYTQKLSENFTRTVAKKPERHTTGPMEIVCPKGKSIKVRVTKKGAAEVECTFTLPGQTPGGVVDLKNLPGGAKRSVLFTNTVTKVAYEVEGNAATCGKNGEKLTNGSLDGEIDVKAFSEGNQIHLDVVGLAAPPCPEEK